MVEKIAFLSDIHGNIDALEQVLRDLEQHVPDRIVVLGDSIGYGPNPRECLRVVMEIADVVLIGNHEKEAVVPSEHGFSGDARAILDWTVQQLEDDVDWQRLSLAMKEKECTSIACIEEDGRRYVHGSPKDPIDQYVWPGHESHYIMYNDQIDAYLNDFLQSFAESHCFCGHTHTPAILTTYQHQLLFQNTYDWNREATFIGPRTIFFAFTGEEITIENIADKKMIINPGGVGQPRDGDPRACYAIYDGQQIMFKRVAYDVARTQNKIMGLPWKQEIKNYFAERLAKGR